MKLIDSVTAATAAANRVMPTVAPIDPTTPESVRASESVAVRATPVPRTRNDSFESSRQEHTDKSKEYRGPPDNNGDGWIDMNFPLATVAANEQASARLAGVEK